MPKLKVLDTRQTSEEIVVMSWSPKMDLLALGSIRGNVHLHRLSWQKVWVVPLAIKDNPVVPELMTWHPEGLFLVVASGETTFVIDVEGGKVVHNHEISFHITTANWCSSHYQHSTSDPLSTHFRQQQIQRLESNLSILFLGTSNGYIYAYTGGFLLGLCIRIAEDPSTQRVLQVNATNSLESFVFTSEEINDNKSSADEVTIVFNHFQNHDFHKKAPIIRPLGLRYILFLKSWATVQGEFESILEQWEKVVELYTHYMTFGGTKDCEVARIDYLELALTGNISVEMEIFLGCIGREKEARKNVNVITSATTAIIESIRTVKCSITNMLVELNEIGGFLRQVSEYDQATNIVLDIQKSISYFFLTILNMQSLVHCYVELFFNFMNLLVNTIHTFNIQDLPDFIEEECETDKVLDFLNITVDKNIVNFLFTRYKPGYTENDDNNPLENAKDESIIISKNMFANIMDPNGGVNKYQDFPDLIHKVLKQTSKNKNQSHSLLLDYSETQVKDLMHNIVPKVNTLTKNLLCIPVLCCVPFEADSFPVIRIPRDSYFLDSKKRTMRKSFHLFLSESLPKTYLSTLVSPKKVLVFEVDFTDGKKPLLKSSILYFTRSVQCFEIFSSNHMTVVSYDKEDKRSEQDLGRTIICQVPFSNIIAQANFVDVRGMRSSSKCGGGKAAVPQSAYVNVPLDVYKPGPTTAATNIDYVLPIEGFAPDSLAVSCARRVGSVLAEDKRTILILEMESSSLDESTLDDTIDDTEDSDSTAN